MKKEIERRFISNYPESLMTFRMDEKDGSPVLRGNAAVFDKLSVDLGGFRETIMPGFFRYALAREDCDPRCLYDHESRMILGRKSSGTLRVTEADALEFECDLPDTSYSRDLQVSSKRGDVRECSFSFQIKETGDSWEKKDGIWYRTLLPDGCEYLYDVSPVIFPAYPDTDFAVRSLKKMQASEVPPVDEMQIRKMRICL